MPAFQLIPYATVQNDVDVFWPGTSQSYSVAAAFDQNAYSRYSGAAIGAGAALFGAKVGAGTANMGLTAQLKIAGQVTSLGGAIATYYAGGFAIRPRQLQGGPALYEAPSWQRIHRVQIAFQLQAAVAASALGKTGIFWQEAGAGIPLAIGNGYAGIALDTAGKWQWVARPAVAGGSLPLETVDVGLNTVPLTAPQTIDFVWLDATYAGPAVFQLYVNGAYNAPVLSRAFPAGLPGVLPQLGGAVAASAAYNFCLCANDAAVATVLQVTAIRASSGQFNPLGVAI